MKKVLLCAAVLFLVFTAAVFAGRAEIDGAIASYEAVVVEAETIAAMDLVSSEEIAALEGKAGTAGEKIKEVEAEREFTIEDAKRAAELNGRFNKAMVTIIVQKLLKY
ncbi:MAG: hypothetical protein FWC24_02905 [Treponema sp.]|nr:hypothetical protein [Treponema sp.]